MNILFVHNSADLYGASRSLLRLCTAIVQSLSIQVLLPEDGPLLDELEKIGVNVTVSPCIRVITRDVLKSWRIIPWLLGFPLSVLRLSIIIKKNNISLVHTNSGVICSTALSAKLCGAKHIWHIRDWFQEFGFLWKPYSRYILSCSDAIICVSTPIKDQFPSSRKLHVIHNGFDISKFHPISQHEKEASRLSLNFQPDDYIVGTVGRVKFHRKGQEYLLYAAKLLHDNNIPVRVIITGGNPPGSPDQIDKMKMLASELHLEPYVLFTGEFKDIRHIYAALDILILPSAQPEPFGGVVMEGMCFGLPVIGTAIGGTLEQIVDGETGYLVPPSDPDSIMEKIQLLFHNPDLRLSMGKKGRQRVKQYFDSDELHQTILSLFKQVTGDQAS